MKMRVKRHDQNKAKHFQRLWSNLKNVSNFSDKFDYFVSNSYLHGLRFLHSRYDATVRMFWTFVLITSVTTMTMVFVHTFKDYLNSAIVFNIETIDLRKNITFPAISICFEKGFNQRADTTVVREFIQTYYAEHGIKEPDHEDFYHNVLDYVHTNPAFPTFSKTLVACNETNSTCGVDIETMIRLVLPKCKGWIYNINFNGLHYHNCEDIFKEKIIYSEGMCFIANSIYFYDLNWNKLPLNYGAIESVIQFKFDLLQRKGHNFWIHFHSPDEFPNTDSNRHFHLYDDEVQEFLIKTTPVENAKNVRDISIEGRNCRFSDERWPENASFPYSFVSCLIYTRVQIDLERCNCTLHFAPTEYKSQYCSYEQMKCIKEHATQSKAIEYHKHVKPCLSTCTGMHVGFSGKLRKEKPRQDEYVQYNRSDPVSGNTTIIIRVLNQSQKLVRKRSFTNLDFVVTIGSIIGLFFGASYLSLFEIVYIWLLRRF